MHIALVNDRTRIIDNPWNAPLRTALTARGIDVAEAAWDEPSVDWSAFDAAVIRCTWNYHEDLRAFLAWLDRAGAATRIFNDPALVAWNAHKGYLGELARAGVPVVETRTFPAGTTANPLLEAQRLGWPEVVLKPAVGAGSRFTWRLRSDAPLPTEAPARLADRDYLMQPFRPEIIADGERSILLFGGAFSHAVRKRPVEGDFRVQVQFGGRYARFEPSSDEFAFAARVLATAERNKAATLYARVDYVITDSGPQLMELEIIEPDLYFTQAPEAAERLAEAVATQTSTN